MSAAPSTELVRASLWLTAPLNVVVAGVFAFPASTAGQLLGLPSSVPALYAGLTASMVALFGFAYGWLATRTEIDRPLLTVGAAGKAGVFVLALALWLNGAVSGTMVLLGGGDLLLASLWFWWLLTR